MELKICYEIKGAQRKAMVQAISDVLNTRAVYKSVPSCADEIGSVVNAF